MKNVLFVNPPYFEDIFSRSKIKSAVDRGIIVLGLAALAAPLREKGHKVSILDLNLQNDPAAALLSALRSAKPDYACITFTTPLFETAKKLTADIKAASPQARVVFGGPHFTALPEESLKNSLADFGVIGEGDFTLLDLVDGKDPAGIEGLVYKKSDSSIAVNARKSYIEDLDVLPYPALDLYDINKYTYPRITARKSPVASMETSRGCFSQCVYCNKNIFGYKYRVKSPGRVVDEMSHILGLGFKEIHIVDDGFTTDLNRAARICDEILTRKLIFPWYVRGGVRVDRVNPDLLKLMKKAGCYRVPFGIESGDQQILDTAKKGIKIEQARNAVLWAKQAGMIVDGYFMIGLPGETEQSIEKTIEFACELPLDYAKFAITIPLPGTALFETMAKNRQIKTTDWSKYNFACSPSELYVHDTLSWETLNSNYENMHRRFFLRPGYILHTAIRSIKEGTLLAHCKAFLKTRW